MTDSGLPVKIIPLDQLKPHPRNYREHPDDQLEHIIRSLEENGFYRNVVVARDWTILAGHGVVKASRRLGLESVPVVQLDVAPEDPRALRVLAGDNETGKLAEVDDRVLTEILKELRDAEPRGLLGSGFSEEQLAALVYVTRPASEVRDMDAAAHWVGLPEYEEGKETPTLIVHFPDEESRETFVAQIGLRIDKKGRERWSSWSTRWPFTEREDAAAVRFVDTEPETEPA